MIIPVNPKTDRLPKIVRTRKRVESLTLPPIIIGLRKLSTELTTNPPKISTAIPV